MLCCAIPQFFHPKGWDQKEGNIPAFQEFEYSWGLGVND
jgi:hypothetical protein